MTNQPINSQYNNPLVFSGLLADVDTGGGLASLVNNTGVDLIVTNIVLNISTAATGAITIDAGVQSTSATTVSDNLIDGVDGHTATGTFGTADGAGANGHLQARWAAAKWLTISTASGASAGMVGTYYITAIPVPAGG